MKKIDKIKKIIRFEIKSEFPDWTEIKRLADEAVIIEDSEGYSYEKE